MFCVSCEEGALKQTCKYFFKAELYIVLTLFAGSEVSNIKVDVRLLFLQISPTSLPISLVSCSTLAGGLQ